MMNEELSRDCKLDECKDLDVNCKEKDCCIYINIFVECDKDHPFKKECKDNKKKEKECCVCINITAK